jgi:hypothetical protein
MSCFQRNVPFIAARLGNVHARSPLSSGDASQRRVGFLLTAFAIFAACYTDEPFENGALTRRILEHAASQRTN